MMFLLVLLLLLHLLSAAEGFSPTTTTRMRTPRSLSNMATPSTCSATTSHRSSRRRWLRQLASTRMGDDAQYSSSFVSTAPASTSTPLLLEAIDELFPPQGLNQRTALSRKDGYWPYISAGDEPPQEFVYGEFDTVFFAPILERAGQLLLSQQQQESSSSSFEDWVFCDLGSGTGRLVLTAAALFPWKLCRGIEILEGIHDQAVDKLEACRCPESSSSSGASDDENLKEIDPDGTTSSSTASTFDSDFLKQYQQYSPSDEWLNDLSASFDDGENPDDAIPTTSSTEPDSTTATTQFDYVLTQSHSGQTAPLAPIDLQCGSFTDPYQFFGDANLVFVYSSAMPHHILVDLALAVGRQCVPGTLVVTTEYQLPLGGTIEPSDDDPSLPHGDYELELLETMTGENESTGGLSTIYIQRLVRSLGDGITRRSPPELPVSEVAYRAIQQLELNKNDPQIFLRNVSNQMIFLGLPDSWRPKLKNTEADDNDDDK